MWSNYLIALTLIQFEKDSYRVFFLNMDSSLARRVLCTVSHCPHITHCMRAHSHAAILVGSMCMHASLHTVCVLHPSSCIQVCACSHMSVHAICVCTHACCHLCRAVTVHACMQAYRRGLTHHYVWITYGWYQDRWWSADVSSQRVECSDQEMVRQVDRALALQLLPEGHDPDAMTDTGLVSGTHTVMRCCHLY